ncbi:MAG: hypothetical protein QG657_1192 [Acidobacteriota bacterium]|nr:hypothetical protein [Acidobacteriota bacterium]
MNKRNFIVFTLCLMGFICSGEKCSFGTDEPDLKQLKLNALNGLTVALEKNMQFREFKNNCVKLSSFQYRGSMKTSVVLIPLKKEVIEAALNYRAVLDNLPTHETARLKEKNYKEFLHGNKAAFIIIVLNNEKFDNDESVFFSYIRENIYLKTDNGVTSKLREYTPGFDVGLNPGWNSGYLFFDNFREYQNFKSYSVHFNNLHIKCGSKEQVEPDWAFSYDDSYENFFALFKDGIDIDEVRKDRVQTTYEKMGFGSDDILNIIKFILKICASV